MAKAKMPVRTIAKLTLSHIETWCGARYTCGYCGAEFEWSDEGALRDIMRDVMKAAQKDGWCLAYFEDVADGIMPCCPKCKAEYAGPKEID